MTGGTDPGERPVCRLPALSAADREQLERDRETAKAEQAARPPRPSSRTRISRRTP